METRNRARWQFVGVVAAFALPLLIAWAVYHQSWSWSSAPGSHGVLLSPIGPLPEFTAVSAKGEAFTNSNLHGRWWLIVSGHAACDLYCEEDLFKSRQVRLALGRDMTRVGLAYVASGSDQPGAGLANKLRANPKLIVLADSHGLAAVLRDPGIYVVDPNGNLVMYYARGSTSRGLRADLKRLLKASRIG